MHFNSSLSKFAVFIVIPMFLFSACTPATNSGLSNGDDNGGYASDASRIEWINEDVISIADAAAYVYNATYLRTTHTTGVGTCATVATDTNSNPHTLIIRFGNSGVGGTTTAADDCSCLDGRKRRGTIIVSYTGHFFDSGVIHTITFDNYFVNDNEFSGTIQTIIADTTITGNHHYSVHSDVNLNMSQDPLQSQFILWNGSFDRKWISGAGTLDRGDDGFLVSGSATLTRANGHQFTFNISSPLQLFMNCNYIESGVVTVSSTDGSRILNYGNGSCDANAQVNIGGTTVYNFTMTP